MVPAPRTPRVRRALLSVSDKTNLDLLGTVLAAHGIELVSTGGTAAELKKAKLHVRDVSEFTGFPEMMDGRLKTLHPKVHGGLLAIRDNPKHCEAMEQHDMKNIDLLVVNLYPFEETVKAGRPFHDCVENIDIGGPAMVRSAAKNHADVVVVVDPTDYHHLINELDVEGGRTTLAFRRRMMAKAFVLIAEYDRAIADYMTKTVPILNAVA